MNRRIERLGGVMVRQVGSHRRYVVVFTDDSGAETKVATIGSRPDPGVNDDGRRFLQELPTQRRKDYARAESSIAY